MLAGPREISKFRSKRKESVSGKRQVHQILALEPLPKSREFFDKHRSGTPHLIGGVVALEPLNALAKKSIDRKTSASCFDEASDCTEGNNTSWLIEKPHQTILALRPLRALGVDP
jgi:hypothetical protein